MYVGHRAPPGDGSDTYLGYVMVETRRHTSGISDLTRLESRAVGECVTRVARALTAVVQAEHVYAFVLGDDVQHFHEHVVARYVGTPRQFWGFRVDQWPGGPLASKSELMKVQLKIATRFPALRARSREAPRLDDSRAPAHHPTPAYARHRLPVLTALDRASSRRITVG